MKRELLDFLLCPSCHSEIALQDLSKEEQEIVHGSLICRGCKKEFPIRGGIPRMVASFEDKSTARRFGYEWKKFPQISPVYEKQFLDWISPIDKDFFRGKVVLDSGCGKGRHVYLASHFGAKTVVGIDVSESVDVAYENTKDLPNVHIIQADICHPPLRKEFDYIYSIGVLHHLSNPERGFKALSGLLKPGGTMSIWVYGREGNRWIIYLVNPLRKYVTSKIPLPLLRMVAILPSLLVYTLCELLYKPVNLHLKSLVRLLPYNDYLFYISNLDFAEIYSIVFDHLLAPIAFYFRKEEVLKWFEGSAFVDLSIAWHNKNSWRVMGRLG